MRKLIAAVRAWCRAQPPSHRTLREYHRARVLAQLAQHGTRTYDQLRNTHALHAEMSRADLNVTLGALVDEGTIVRRIGRTDHHYRMRR